MSVPAETSPESPPQEEAHETVDASVARHGTAWRQDEEPELAGWLQGHWDALPTWSRIAGAVAILLCLVWATAGIWNTVETPQDDDAIAREAAVARTAWAASRRQAPTPLAPEEDGSAFASGSLEPGDAETASGLYVDFLSYTAADSSAFTVVATSAGFTPDVSVRTPDGRRLASSVLLGTDSRAEVVGLRGPGLFQIAVTSVTPGASGAYEVTAGPSTALDTLHSGDPLRADTLGRGRPRAGRYEVAYSLVADPDAPVIVDVVSSSFAPRLTLLGPAGEIRQQRTLERGASGDSLFGVVLRFQPGWDLPYTLLVSSDQKVAKGAFALEMRTLDAASINPNGRAVTGELGVQSWLREGRYVDAYTFRIASGEDLEVGLQSSEFAPAYQLWREERRGFKEVLSEENRSEAAQVTTKKSGLQPGTYILEVTSSDIGEGGAYPSGDYALKVTSERPAPPPSSSSSPSTSGSSDGPSGWTSGARGSATGTADGNSFAVSVDGVSVSYPGGRTRIQLSVRVRSIDYSGPWAPWRSFASKAALMDNQGRQYRSASAEGAGTGVVAEPGSERRGRLVFYADGTYTDMSRLVFSASLGDGVSVPISLDISR